MITWRDNLAILLGAAGAVFVLALLDPLGAPGGALAGALVAAAVARRRLKRSAREMAKLRLARDTYKLELLAAWGESDRLRRHLGQAPLPRPRLLEIVVRREAARAELVRIQEEG